ncbi:hypothetical protein DRN93_01485 [archaeon]|nr:MAG: hypothetical protein DRN93_01485 [archaeon]
MVKVVFEFEDRVEVKDIDEEKIRLLFPELYLEEDEEEVEEEKGFEVLIVDDEWIEKQQTSLGAELVPLEHRRYIKREDIGKLPKGLKIYQGVRGGLFFDAREYERLTGKKPEIGERRVEEPREEKPVEEEPEEEKPVEEPSKPSEPPPDFTPLRLHGLEDIRGKARRKQIEKIFKDLDWKVDFAKNYGLWHEDIVFMSKDRADFFLRRRYGEYAKDFIGMTIRKGNRFKILINASSVIITARKKPHVPTLSDIIELSKEIWSKMLAGKERKEYLMWVFSYRAQSFIEVLFHELGHYIRFRKKFNRDEERKLKSFFLEEKKEDELGRNRLISVNAGTNLDEYWADHYEAFMLAPRLHKYVYPELHEFMVEWHHKRGINIEEIWKNMGVLV